MREEDGAWSEEAMRNIQEMFRIYGVKVPMADQMRRMRKKSLELRIDSSLLNQHLLSPMMCQTLCQVLGTQPLGSCQCPGGSFVQLEMEIQGEEQFWKVAELIEKP